MREIFTFPHYMCYSIETITFDDPLFKNVDATYILHLEDDVKRYADIQEQLKTYHPTKTVHIVFNPGYKKCEKPGVRNAPEDLVHTVMYALNDARRYETILILEDDFMFDPSVTARSKDIDDFVSTHTDFIYRLGGIPYLQVPVGAYTYAALVGGTHSVLLSKSMRAKIETTPPKNIDWDVYLNLVYPNYLYCRPLCCQLFPPTENRKVWGMHHWMLRLGGNLLALGVHLLRLDTQCEPGYTIMYLVSKLIPIFILMGVIVSLCRA